MPLTDAALDIGSEAIIAAITEMSLHTADPGTTGTSETTAARQAPVFTATNGDIALSAPEAFTGGAANGPCTFVGLWAGATFAGGFALTGDQTFNAAGEYTVDGLTIPFTAT